MPHSASPESLRRIRLCLTGMATTGASIAPNRLQTRAKIAGNAPGAADSAGRWPLCCDRVESATGDGSGDVCREVRLRLLDTLTELVTYEAAHRDLLADLRRQLVGQLLDGLLAVDHRDLLDQTGFLQPL